MEPKKNCENCRYFVQYYLKNKNGSFSRIHGRGHCKNGGKISARLSPCDFWEPIEIQITERRERITQTLCKMEQHLREIAIMLKDDLSD